MLPEISRTLKTKARVVSDIDSIEQFYAQLQAISFHLVNSKCLVESSQCLLYELHDAGKLITLEPKKTRSFGC